MPPPSVPLNAIRQPAFLYDAGARIIAANDLAEALAGRSLAGVPASESLCIFDHRHPGGGVLRPEELPVCRALAGGEVVDLSLTVRAADGGRLHVLATASPIREDGRIAGALVIWNDVTPGERLREALAESEAKYRNLVELAPDAILIHQDGHIVFANPAAAALLGAAAPDDLLGRPILDLVHPGTRAPVAENIELDLRGAETPVTVTELLRVDGTTVTAQGRGVRIPFGGRPAIQVFLRDVTAEQRSAAALQASEERLRLAQESADIAVWDWSMTTGAVTYTPEFLRPFGVEVGSITDYDAWRRLVHPEDIDRVEAERDGAIARGEPFSSEFRVITPSGEVRWVQGTGRGICDPSGALVRIIGVNQDITGRREGEAALRESEERLRLAKACAGIGTWEWHLPSADGRGSGGYVRLLDPDVGEVLVDGWQGMVQPDDLARVEAERDAALARGEPFELEFRYDDGSGLLRWMRVIGGGVFDEGGRLLRVLGVNLDITAQKQAEEALRESEGRLRDVLEISLDVVYRRDLVADRYDYLSPVIEEITGLSAGEFAGLGITEVLDQIHPDDRSRVLASLEEGAAAGRGTVEYRLRQRDGNYRWVSDYFVVQHDDSGAPTLRGGVLRDITASREAEEALRDREQTLRGVFRAAPMGIGMVSHRIITQVNDQLCRMTGYSREELVGQDARMLYPSDEAYDYVGREKYAQILEDGVGAVETQWRRKDGVVRDVLVSSSPVDLVRPYENVVFNALDITRLQESERALETYMEELHRSNEELQRFAYVASHDLQEPLRSIISFTQLLERRYKGQLGEDADEYIGFIVEGGMRMQQLIMDLLQLSRVETKAKPLVPTDAGEVVADALALMETAIREAGATIEVGALPTVMADAAQLTQVFTNLVGNALKYRRLDVPPEVRISAKRMDGMVEFAVQDNGIGIEAEYYDRIFVIFQRLHTRDEYEGTGIGLAVVRKIVERHGGHIDVVSVPGEGSTFSFTLPAVEPV